MTLCIKQNETNCTSMNIILLLSVLFHIIWTFGQQAGTRDIQIELLHHDQIEAKDNKLNENAKENGKDNYLENEVGLRNLEKSDEKNKTLVKDTARKDTQDIDLDQIGKEDFVKGKEYIDKGEKEKDKGKSDLDKYEEDPDKGKEYLYKDEEDPDKGEKEKDKAKSDLDKYEEDPDKGKADLDKGKADLDKDEEDPDKGKEDLYKDEEDLYKDEKDQDKSEEDLDKYNKDLDNGKEDLSKTQDASKGNKQKVARAETFTQNLIIFTFGFLIALLSNFFTHMVRIYKLAVPQDKINMIIIMYYYIVELLNFILTFQVVTFNLVDDNFLEFRPFTFKVGLKN